jgi:hypothetical protein
MVPILTMLLIACCTGYGWCIQRRVNIAVSLVIQVFGEYDSSILEHHEFSVSEVGLVTISVMNSTQMLMRLGVLVLPAMWLQVSKAKGTTSKPRVILGEHGRYRC